MTQPINPYVAGMPLRGEKGFFGRQTSLAWVANELRNPGTNAVVLFGQRRIGKSSLLLQLQRSLSKKDFLPIYFDLQDQATRPLENLLADLADSIAERAGYELPENMLFNQNGRVFQKEFLPNLFRHISNEQRLVLLLDEFDVMDQAAEADLPAEAAAKSLLPFLRKLMNEEARVCFVFVAGRRPQDLSLDFSATFKASLSHELWVLDEVDARVLIQQAEKNNTLNFTETAISRILALTNRHPYLTQLLCQRIWEKAYSKNSKGIPMIDISEVEAIIPIALETGGQALKWLWEGLSPAERVFASALSEISKEAEPISEDRVVQLLSAYAARLRTREVELAPRDLVQRKVIEPVSERSYRFALELFRRWIRENRPLQSVKDELDRVDKTADRIFRAGEGFFYEQKWEDAISYFKHALTENPSHFRAQLLLGESFLHQNRTLDAVVALKKAYELDQADARLPLVRAWIAHAKYLARRGEKNLALNACEEIQKLSPNERSIKELRELIWNQEGDSAWERNDLNAALIAYKEANNIKKIKAVEELKSENEELDKKFSIGLDALNKGHWNEAVTSFEWIVHRRPAYSHRGQKAVHLLGQAIEEGEKPPFWLWIWLRRPTIIVGLMTFVIILFLFIALTYWGIRGVGPLAELATDTPTPTSTPTKTPTPLFTPTNTQSPTPFITLTPSILSLSTNTPVPPNSPQAVNSSVLGFCLFGGLIIVFGLVALNVWARRRP